jgi:dihydroneopterin aldolase
MTVGFSGLKIHCSIGILPHEQLQLQEIFVDLKVLLPTLPNSEDISSTIDYSVLAALCETIALLRHRPLIETLAADMLDALFERFSCTYAWIRIEKPLALNSARCSFVEFEKERSL